MGRNILVFLDGTRNKPSDARQRRDTNVWKLYAAAASRQQGTEDLTVYLRGVGTLPEAEKQRAAAELRFARLGQWLAPLDRARRRAQRVAQLPKRIAVEYGAAAVGWGVADRIREAYAFVCEHYRPGDHVYLFGFSRGAFEARSLAGFVDAVGLLLLDPARGPDPRRLVDIAYDLYRRGDPQTFAFLRKFLRRVTGRAAPVPGADSRRLAPAELHFVGVWDTVEALGVGDWNEKLPVVRRHTRHHQTARLPACVRHGRHALALHELRHKFEPTPWTAAFPDQDIVQCWFAGAHADVGGGYPEPELAQLALHWMAGEAQAVSARTTQPLRFAGLPPLPAAAARLPHHAIQGEFFWATPSPRAALSSDSAWAALVGQVLVHPSALGRLFDPASTAYAAYPFEPDLRWAERLGIGAEYPRDVAGALHWIDDRSLCRHLAISEQLGRAFLHRRADEGRPSFWRLVSGVVDLRLLDDRLARAVPAVGESPSGSVRLGDALALLVVCGRGPTVDAFVQRVVAAVDALIVQAAASTEAGLAVRDRWLPVFQALHHDSALPEQPLPPGVAAILQAVHDRLVHECSRLRARLPFRAPRTAVLRPRLRPGPVEPGQE